jgi:hypothetical protein
MTLSKQFIFESKPTEQVDFQQIPSWDELALSVENGFPHVAKQSNQNQQWQVEKYMEHFTNQQALIQNLERQIIDAQTVNQKLKQEIEEMKKIKLYQEGLPAKEEARKRSRQQMEVQESDEEDTEEVDEDNEEESYRPSKRAKFFDNPGYTATMVVAKPFATLEGRESAQLPKHGTMGTLNTGHFTTFKNETYATAKAFPNKRRLQELKLQYEIETKISASYLCVHEDLKQLKLENKNILGHCRQVTLFTLPFIHYYIKHET